MATRCEEASERATVQGESGRLRRAGGGDSAALGGDRKRRWPWASGRAGGAHTRPTGSARLGLAPTRKARRRGRRARPGHAARKGGMCLGAARRARRDTLAARERRPGEAGTSTRGGGRPVPAGAGAAQRVVTWLILPVAYACLKD